ncbi:hypothetical protein [Bacteroides propionicifaciens]|jgi:4-hydroxybenzoate polyprenyltransferase|uniref:hypothetical protein n=1 Tax=Bacteroides propionicifaciens TaxID=392838 RepID=UPI0003688991|nr:hypothetical protein [Bacteroides propionicifaciens]
MSRYKSNLVSGLFWLLSICLIVFVGLGLKSGFELLYDYYWLFLILFLAWWISLFAKMKQDNQKRKDRVKNFGDRIRRFNK